MSDAPERRTGKINARQEFERQLFSLSYLKFGARSCKENIALLIWFSRMLIKSPLPGEYKISAWGFIFRFAFASFICEGSEITEH